MATGSRLALLGTRPREINMSIVNKTLHHGTRSPGVLLGHSYPTEAFAGGVLVPVLARAVVVPGIANHGVL
jgi:hypothetical protein